MNTSLNIAKRPDTLITSGPLNDRCLLGSAIKSEHHMPPPTEFQLSLVRILFYCGSRLEDLIYPVSQCNSWFVSLYITTMNFLVLAEKGQGLLNKRQQILELLGNEEDATKSDGEPKRSVIDGGVQKPSERDNLTSDNEAKANRADKLKSRDISKAGAVDKEQRIPPSKRSSMSSDAGHAKTAKYKFWYEDECPVPVAISINNWASVLRSGRHKEVLNVWMREDSTSTTVQLTMDNILRGPSNPVETERGDASVPSLIKPFLTWPIVDEFGESDPLDVDDRCERFLRAFVLDLPVPVIMSRDERAKRPKQASKQRVAAKASISIDGKTLTEVRSEIKADGDDPLAVEICDKFERVLGFFLPASYGTKFVSDSLRLYWGAVSVITVRQLLGSGDNELTIFFIQAATKNRPKTSGIHGLSLALNVIIADADRIHRGVYCSVRKKCPDPLVWRDEDTIADAAVLLSATVEALGAIFRILVESVRFIRSDGEIDKAAMMEPSSAVSQHAKEASIFLGRARDQLIRKADGKDKNDTIGPVLTPEAITITLLRRLVTGVFGSGRIEIISLYEECLEHLVLRHFT